MWIKREWDNVVAFSSEVLDNEEMGIHFGYTWGIYSPQSKAKMSNSEPLRN